VIHSLEENAIGREFLPQGDTWLTADETRNPSRYNVLLIMYREGTFEAG
jgi:hypothetical protein